MASLTPSTPRFVLMPGHVASINDAQLHYIDAQRLAFLYQLRADDFEVAATQSELNYWTERGLIPLHPRAHGDYVEHRDVVAASTPATWGSVVNSDRPIDVPIARTATGRPVEQMSEQEITDAIKYLIEKSVSAQTQASGNAQERAEEQRQRRLAQGRAPRRIQR